MSKYPTVPLIQVADFFSGGTPSKQNSSYWSGSIPWLTPKDMGQWNGLTEESVSELAIGNGTRIADPGAIFIAVRGMSLHHEIRIIRSDEALTFNQDIKAIVPKEGTDARYLYYALQAKKSELLDSVEAAGHGTGRLPTDILEATDIPEVSPSYQDSVGGFFGLLDEKIKLNTKMNEKLHAAAHALFEDWFVNFGPTQRKIEGGHQYLAKDLWEQFPNSFDTDGVPQGWSTEPLDDIADFLNGLALQKFPPDAKETLPVIKIAELRQGVTSKSDRASLKIPKEYVIENGDVLFSWSGTLTHLVWAGGTGALNQHLFKVTSQSVPKWFYFYWISEHMPAFQAIAASKATTMGHIQRHHLHEAMTTVPSEELLVEADRMIGPLFDQAIRNSIESERLGQLRDLLLPGVLSGEVHLKDAENVTREML